MNKKEIKIKIKKNNKILKDLAEKNNLSIKEITDIIVESGINQISHYNLKEFWGK